MGARGAKQAKGKGALRKRPRKNRVARDPKKPKRATTAYFHYMAACRKEAAASGRSISKVAEFTKECSVKWRALSADKRKPFDALAAKDKERYAKQMRGYKAPVGIAKPGKAEKDPRKPKKPMSAFFLFLSDFRSKAGKNLPTKEVAVKAGQMWRTMTTSKKQPYVANAEKAAKKHKAAMIKYKKTR